MLKPNVTQHVGIDHADTLHDKASIDLLGTAYAIPVADEYFDTAICTAVLEHLEEPDRATKETKRVLKRGAMLFTLFRCSGTCMKSRGIFSVIRSTG
jgi:ubiquinone/menaquinone biosynthesis C-methylase UbiE